MLSPEYQAAICNVVARWLAMQADADDAKLIVTLTRDGVTVHMEETQRVPVPPIEGEVV
jgi:hypothetical protein